MSEPDEREALDTERLTFFTDAVVAIAMTLLILPLLESVSSAADKGWSTAQFFDENRGQLLAFALSFVIIARFWAGHQDLFEHVAHRTTPLMVLNTLWMLAIVFLPVATALVGSLDTDRLQLAVYIGTMLTASLLMGVMSYLLHHDPRLWPPGGEPSGHGVAISLSLVLLYAVALGLAMIPGVGYLGLLVLFLQDPLERLLRRVLRASWV